MVIETEKRLEGLQSQADSLRKQDTSDIAVASSLASILKAIDKTLFEMGEEVYKKIQKEQKSNAGKLTKLRKDAEQAEAAIEKNLSAAVESIRKLYTVEQQIKMRHGHADDLSRKVAAVEGKTHKLRAGYVIGYPWQRSKAMPAGVDAWLDIFIKRFITQSNQGAVETVSIGWELSQVEQQALELYQQNRMLERQHVARAKSAVEQERKKRLPSVIKVHDKYCHPVALLERLCNVYGIEHASQLEGADKIKIEKELETLMRKYRVLPCDVRDIRFVFDEKRIAQWEE